MPRSGTGGGDPDPGSGAGRRNRNRSADRGERNRYRTTEASRRVAGFAPAGRAGRLGPAPPLTRTFRAAGQETRTFEAIGSALDDGVSGQPASRKLTLKRLSGQGGRADLRLLLVRLGLRIHGYSPSFSRVMFPLWRIRRGCVPRRGALVRRLRSEGATELAWPCPRSTRPPLTASSLRVHDRRPATGAGPRMSSVRERAGDQSTLRARQARRWIDEVSPRRILGCETEWRRNHADGVSKQASPPAASTRSSTPLWPLSRNALEAQTVTSWRPPRSASAEERVVLFVVRGAELSSPLR